MGRGLDGYFFVVPEVGGLCSFEGPRWGVVLTSSVALAWGKHLFPFRTEQLSPTAPMVLGLHGPGRVGRRRFFTHGPPLGRPVVVNTRSATARPSSRAAPGGAGAARGRGRSSGARPAGARETSQSLPAGGRRPRRPASRLAVPRCGRAVPGDVPA